MYLFLKEKPCYHLTSRGNELHYQFESDDTIEYIEEYIKHNLEFTTIIVFNEELFCRLSGNLTANLVILDEEITPVLSKYLKDSNKTTKDIKKYKENSPLNKTLHPNYTFRFGKYQGKTVKFVKVANPGYLEWFKENVEMSKW